MTMPLISCPSCKGIISDKAMKCVHCGYRLGSTIEYTNLSLSPQGRDYLLKHCFALVLIILLALVGALFFTPLMGLIIGGPLLASWCKEAARDLRSSDFTRKQL